MRLLLLSIFAILTPCAGLANVRDSVDPEKAAVILELLQVTGAHDLGQRMMSKMVEIQMQGAPQEIREKIDRFASRMDTAEIIDELVVMYDRNFTKADLLATLEFHKSEAGSRMLQKLPIVMEESRRIGEAWAKRKLIELNEEIEAELEAGSEDRNRAN